MLLNILWQPLGFALPHCHSPNPSFLWLWPATQSEIVNTFSSLLLSPPPPTRTFLTFILTVSLTLSPTFARIWCMESKTSDKSGRNGNLRMIVVALLDPAAFLAETWKLNTSCACGVLSPILSTRWWSGVLATTMGLLLESFRLVTASVNCTATPSIVSAKDQEMLREPRPFSVAARLLGVEGTSMCIQL